MKPHSADAEELFLKAEKSEERGDFENAFRYLLSAAEIGHSSSQLNLANFYSAGKGVSTNTKEAAKWYRRAYRNGNRSGALNLAIDLQNEGQIRAAMTWLNRAIEMNDGDACVALAKLSKSKNRKIALLTKAISMSADDITEDTRNEAKALLKELEKTKSKPIL